jgi:UDP-N-acetylglucosamine transferase subunit ALG13
LALLKSEFPNLQFIRFPGKIIKYPGNRFMTVKMFLSLPSILLGIIKEHQLLKKIIADNNIDIVISDNRYGLWNKSIRSIFITHQIGIKLPGLLCWLKPLLLSVNKFFIHKYDQLWIPDYEDEPNITGSLSHGYKLKIPHNFIGILSRFKKIKDSEKKVNTKILAIISGPEPQRTLFEKKLISNLQDYSEESIILQGKTEIEATTKIGNTTLISHLPTIKLQSLISGADIIICRSGYTSIMELASLNKKAIFVPTPGQTEQEYLAKKLKEKRLYYSMGQGDFDIKIALKEQTSYTGIDMKNNSDLLSYHISKLSLK